MGKRMYDFKQTLDAWKQRDAHGQQQTTPQAAESGAMTQAGSIGSPTAGSEEAKVPGLGKEGEKETREAYGGLAGITNVAGRSNQNDDAGDPEKQAQEKRAEQQQKVKGVVATVATLRMLEAGGRLMSVGHPPIVFDHIESQLEHLEPVAAPLQMVTLRVVAALLRGAVPALTNSPALAAPLIVRLGEMLSSLAADERYPALPVDTLNQAGQLFTSIAPMLERAIPPSLPTTPVPDTPGMVHCGRFGVLPLEELTLRQQQFRDAGTMLLGMGPLASEAMSQCL